MRNDRTMKLRITLALATAMLITATACASDKPNSDVDTDQTTDTRIVVPKETKPPVNSDTTEPAELPEDTEPLDTTDIGETTADTASTDDSAEILLRAEVSNAWRALFPSDYFLPELIDDEVEWRTDVTCALLMGDGASLAEVLNVPTEVYACYDGMEIREWGVRKATVDNGGYSMEYMVLDVTVAKSNVPTIPTGEHSFVLEAGLEYTFLPLADSAAESKPFTSAQSFVNSQINNIPEFGICDYIVERLNAIADNYEPRTREEIEEYAKVCLDLDPSELEIEEQLVADGDGYQRIGRGGVYVLSSFIGEEKRGDTTVVTVRFWADYSKTVEAKVVEYHLVPTDIDWKLVDTVTIRDNGFHEAIYSV